MSIKLKVLVACEESQAVTKEFRALGHEAFSCDIEPSSGGHPAWHYQQDVTELLKQDWDIVIAFPPCTHLAVSGARHFEQKRLDGRQQQGIDFFKLFTILNCEHVAIENPIGIMSRLYRKPDQIVQPWQFGHPFSKSTCLWLKGLPKLVHAEVIEKPTSGWENQSFTKDGRYGGFNGKFNDSKTRSKTFEGIAKAMATQWSEYVIKQKTT